MRKWFNIFRKGPAPPPPPSSPSRSPVEACSVPRETAAPGQEAQTSHFFAAFVNTAGNPIDFPGVGNILKMTRDDVSRIRKADDFLDQLRTASSDYSQSFTLHFEFDVYSLLMIWMPRAEGCDLAEFCFNSFSFDDHGAPVEQPPCTLLFCEDECLPDQGTVNVISGMWEIGNVSEVLARYHQRPLALIISQGPGDALSAAALTFAGARYLFGLTGLDRIAKVQGDA